MTFQQMQTSRIVRAVAIVFGAGLVISFLTSCFLGPILPSTVTDQFSRVLNMFSNPDTPPEQIRTELDNLRTMITDEFGTQLNAQYVAQWALTTLVVFWMARWTARIAISREQAVGYGLAVGIGAAMTYGILCVMCSIALLWIRLIFLGLFVFAGRMGGLVAAQTIDFDKQKREPLAPPSTPRASPFGGFPSGKLSQPRTPAPSGEKPSVYYNMGVSAALGGRRDEARQHFTRVVQIDPRHVEAWLQLANLADSPEQAWNYVQQARSIDPDNPHVQDAVDKLWPKVAASAERRPPSAQPPYRGADFPSDAIIPESDSVPPPAPGSIEVPPETDSEPGTQSDDTPDDTGDDTPPPFTG